MNKLSIRFLLIFNTLSILLLIVAMFVVGHTVTVATQNVFQTYEARYQSYLLADELRQSSDDLTRLARTYVVSNGNPAYEQQYNDILAIRNGEKLRPQEYHRIYWDYISAGQAKPRPDTQAIALTELMKQAGFSEAEFQKLREAQANSNELVSTEVRAMNAVKGLFADDKGAYTISRPPDFELARQLMHSPEYHAYKAKIMAPLDEFFKLLATRTQADIVAAQAKLDKSNWIFHLLELATLLMTCLLGWLVYSKTIPPLEKLIAAAKAMAQGNFENKLALKHQDEVGTLVQCMDGLQNKVQAMYHDTHTLTNAALAGNLGTRADATRHAGIFQEIIQGINQTLDAVIHPLEMAATYVDQIAQGEIPPKITETYHGDFSALKNNLNTCIEAIRNLITDTNNLHLAATSGNLDKRADAGRHQGDYRKIVQGVNQTLDALIKPVGRVADLMVNVSQGDLTQTISDQYEGDLETFKASVNSTVEQLREIIDNIKVAADSIQTAAKEISAGNSNLSRRTEEQAAMLEETASSMEQLAATVKGNAENARQANQMATEASNIAVMGGEVVGEVVSTMSGINDSSLKIVDIISVIDGIAFQTNILALNAAVEAARAGEQGRGFAVVAVEVRNLAQRAAAAAEEIKVLISDSVDKIKTGTSLVEKAGHTMQDVVSSVKRVSGIMANISTASEEQSSGIDQVNKAITQMDHVTQQNAALVEQATAAAESLEEQVGILRQSVDVFVLS